MKYSRSQISKSGKLLRKGNDEQSVLDLSMDRLVFWKSKHAEPLEQAYKEIVNAALTIDNLAIVARREKRARSIINKLRREPTMSLTKMQDIGGCRAIVRTEKDVKKISSMLRKKKHISSANNYLKKPKLDGYRGIHLVGYYDVEGLGRLPIEFQLRTKIHHAWSTAGEITELFTAKDIKHLQGDEEWKSFYKELSDFFDIIQQKFVTRDFDFENFNFKSLGIRLSRILNDEQRHKFKLLRDKEKQLKVRRKFDTYANSLKIVDEALGDKAQGQGYAVVHASALNTIKPTVSVSYYAAEHLGDAQKKTYDIEKRILGGDTELVVLLSTQAIGGIREAYPNYFADSLLFMRLLQSTVDFY